MVDADGNTALMLAVQNRRYVSDSTIRLLIERSDISHVNMQNNAGNTALHLACMAAELRSDDKIVALLTQKHFDLCMRNNEGNTVVHIACLYGHSHVAKQLLRSRLACPPLENIRNEDGDTILHLACKQSLWEAVEQMIFFVHNFTTDLSAYELLYETRNRALKVPIDYVEDAAMRQKLFILQDPRLKAFSYDIEAGSISTVGGGFRTKSTAESNFSSSIDDEFILIGEGVDVEQYEYSLD